MTAKAQNKTHYFLGSTGCKDWNQALDDYLELKKEKPQLTWHNFYTARKEVADSLEDVREKVTKEVDIIQNSGNFRA